MKESKRPILPRHKAEHIVTLSAALLVLIGGLLAVSAWRGSHNYDTNASSLPASPTPTAQWETIAAHSCGCRM